MVSHSSTHWTNTAQCYIYITSQLKFCIGKLSYNLGKVLGVWHYLRTALDSIRQWVHWAGFWHYILYVTTKNIFWHFSCCRKKKNHSVSKVLICNTQVYLNVGRLHCGGQEQTKERISFPRYIYTYFFLITMSLLDKISILNESWCTHR